MFRWIWESEAGLVVSVLPLSCSVEAPGATAQVTTVRVGASVSAGVVRRGALVNVLAPTKTVLEVKPWWTHALVAAQSVVAWGGATHLTASTLILICRGGGKQWEEETDRGRRVSNALKVKGWSWAVFATWNENVTRESVKIAFHLSTKLFSLLMKLFSLHTK